MNRLHSLAAVDPEYGTIPVAGPLEPEPAALAVQEGLATTTAVANEAHQGILEGDRAELVRSYPALVALWDAYDASNAMYGPNGTQAQFPNQTPAQLVAEMDASANFGFDLTVPGPTVAAYRAAFVKYLAKWWPQIAYTRQRIAEAENVADIWAQGEILFGGMRWPTALILDGPKTLPDGMAYIITKGPPWDPDNGEFYLAAGPNYNPAEGAWFVAQFPGDKVDYAPVPSWYTGPLDISPMLRAALMNQPWAIIRTLSTVPVHVPTEPPIVNTLPSGNPGGGPVVLPDIVVTAPKPMSTAVKAGLAAVALALLVGSSMERGNR